jgi:hypothetical protein
VRKSSLSALVEELVASVTNNAQPNSDDINNLFSALDKGRNTEPLGRLKSQERQTGIPFEEPREKPGI